MQQISFVFVKKNCEMLSVTRWNKFIARTKHRHFLTTYSHDQIVIRTSHVFFETNWLVRWICCGRSSFFQHIVFTGCVLYNRYIWKKKQPQHPKSNPFVANRIDLMRTHVPHLQLKWHMQTIFENTYGPMTVGGNRHNHLGIHTAWHVPVWRKHETWYDP